METDYRSSSQLEASDGDGDYCPGHWNSSVWNRVIKALKDNLDNGQQVDAMADDINNSLFSAVHEGDLEKVRKLIDAYGISYPRAWSRGYDLLCDAVENNHTEITKLLLTEGSKVNSSNKRLTNTPLHFAVRNGNLEIVEMLLDRDADIEAKNKWGKTPLHNAIEHRHMKIIKLLLNRGANVNTSFDPRHLKYRNYNHSTFKDGYAPLHVATSYGSEKFIKLLLSSNADVDCKGTNGITPLHIAAKKDNLQIVKILLKHGANVDAQDKDGTTVLQCAVKKRCCRIVKHILKFCPDVNNKGNKSSINIAVQGCGEQFKTILEYLIQYGFTVNPEDVNNCELLHVAIKKGYLKLVEQLLKSGADVNMLFSNNNTPLHCATEKKQEEIVTLLINYGANVNADNNIGKPAIFYAIENKDLKITTLLLTNGANVNDRPDLLSAAVKKKCREIVEILLQHNADVNATDENGLTALHFTVLRQDDFEPFSFMFYTSIIDEYYDNKTEEIAKLLLSCGANVNAQSKKNTTPLHAAAHKGNVEICKLLLNKGANVNAKREDGGTALHLATELGNKKVVEVLLQSGAKVDSKTQRGTTPLHIAAQKNSQIVKNLLKFGADIDARDEHGETALHVACNTQIVEVLLECGSDINIMNKKSNSTPLDLSLNCAISCGRESLIMKEHVIKLQTANLYVCDRNLLSITDMDDFKNICDEEIKRMKNEKIIINNNVSFYDILTKNIDLVAAYTRNESLVQGLKSNDYKTKFPLYASMINCHFKKGVERKELLEQGFNIIPELPYNCTENIFYYLSNKDIRMLIDAYKPSNVGSPSTETLC